MHQHPLEISTIREKNLQIDGKPTAVAVGWAQWLKQWYQAVFLKMYSEDNMK